MRMMVEGNAQPISHLIFRLGSQQYALAIDQVIEVAAMVELVQTPDTPPALLGVANRHGEVLPMLDLCFIFDQQAAQIDASTLFIVARHVDQQLGLVVDEVQQVEHLLVGQLTQRAPVERYIQAIITHQEKIIQRVALPALIAAFLPQDMLESSLT